MGGKSATLKKNKMGIIACNFSQFSHWNDGTIPSKGTQW